MSNPQVFPVIRFFKMNIKTKKKQEVSYEK